MTEHPRAIRGWVIVALPSDVEAYDIVEAYDPYDRLIEHAGPPGSTLIGRVSPDKAQLERRLRALRKGSGRTYTYDGDADPGLR